MSKSEREAVVDLAKYADQKVRVRIQGGREVEGILRGFDKLDNLVLDDTFEFLRGLSSIFPLLSIIAHSFVVFFIQTLLISVK